MRNDTCAVLSAFDLMKGSKILAALKVWADDEPDLIPTLRNSYKSYENPSIARAYERVRNEADRLYQIKLGVDTEDPFLIIGCIKRILLRYNNNFRLEPIIAKKCLCYGQK